ncbi:MAG: NAD-dependent dehydratase [Balneola sp.]|jgi:uncharacterized protein YbjT (DUF2867 family)|nr:NAD-dependent dehydratase [Balneola sp.]MBE80174.1 NAD-dependent dehydratase [Balneola sp.]|tara:strand:- start:66 stop:713 length:648 start_codon:yes stop_codon:yes gene_type:complete
MNVLVIGANGQIGKKLVHQLKEKGHQPKAMIRKKEQIDQFEKNGIDTVLADLEEDISHAFEGVDAVVFTAGSGGNTPKSQTKVIDRDGAIKAIDETKKSGADRFIMVSALKANRDENTWSKPMEHYYEAKAKADEYLRNTDLNYTVLMPGRLTNKEGNSQVILQERIDPIQDETITRSDVASVITEIMEEKATFRKSLELLQGEDTIKKAIEKLG